MTIAISPFRTIDPPWHHPSVADALARMFGERPVATSCERTHFPGERPVQVVLSVELAGGAACRTVFAERCTEGASAHADVLRARLRKSRYGQSAGFDPDAVVAADEAGLILRRPGFDERLPGLRLLHDADFARGAVNTVLGRDCGPLVSELVAHRLGKRAVLRISGADLTVYARLRSIKSGDGTSRLERHRALWHSLKGQCDLRIPEPLGELPEIGAAFFGKLPGDAPDFSGPDVEAISRAIAALQELDPQGLPIHSGADEARILLQWLERCKAWQPDLAARIAPGLSSRITALESAPPVLRPCHRDLHEKQVLVSDGVAGLLDFDTLSLSDPAVDSGNLLAHLVLAGLDEAPLRARLDGPGIGLWRSAALFRLAMIYAFTSTSFAVLDRLIEEADGHAGD